MKPSKNPKHPRHPRGSPKKPSKKPFKAPSKKPLKKPFKAPSKKPLKAPDETIIRKPVVVPIVIEDIKKPAETNAWAGVYNGKWDVMVAGVTVTAMIVFALWVVRGDVQWW